ncbi:C2 calcium-dependent domain-containing protein 4C isoform X2 [Betta splendens]|uniref:C2 calcium-dependent domain-containing protein 4C isoform X2 n=1 Tax=Betta splendens TaxID=158456 RepID=A0A9W2XRZ2_BETSP|nr:C2 calcium-dependent domain-containing protein 4C isoform X2 [Betta splendens]XP_055364474.1 C2 calcium-dependent domain-containing protein 4C isoform X2 [Betta splendens]
MWVLDKIRGSVETGVLRQAENGDRRSVGPAYSNVLTPDKIPDFFIPPKLVSCPPEPETPSPRAKEGLQPSASEQTLGGGGGRKISSPRSPRLVAKIAGDTKSLLRAANRHIIQIESADDVVAGDTNADPQSQTAMSLPYVPKTHTSYGFATLKESPHTRRKESLFHCEITSPITSPNTQRRSPGRSEGNHLNPADFSASHMNPYRYFSGGESDTCSSAESSPFSSPLLSRSASLLKIFTHETQAKVVKAKRSLARHSSLSTDECSSAEPSPSVPRRLHVPALHGGAGACASDHGLQREHAVSLHKGGVLRISAHHDAGTSRLRIRVLAAESLYDKHVDIKSINCCVSVYLNPGKQQKQRSNIIKNSRNPAFNEDFFFDAIGAAHVKSLSVKFKACFQFPLR